MPFSRSQQPGVFGGPECPYRGRPFAEQNKDVGPDHLYDWPPALPESDAFVREQVRHHFHDGPLVPGTVLTDVPAATDDHFVTLDTEDLRELMVPTAQLLHQTGSHNSPAPAVGGPAVDLELDAQQNHPDSLPLTTSSAIPFDRAPASEIPRLQAAVHQRHPAWFSELKDEDICVEHITGDEVDEARRLHQEWFPLKYDEAFYAAMREMRLVTLLAKAEGEILGLISLSLSCAHHAEVMDVVFGESCEEVCEGGATPGSYHHGGGTGGTVVENGGKDSPEQQSQELFQDSPEQESQDYRVDLEPSSTGLHSAHHSGSGSAHIIAGEVAVRSQNWSLESQATGTEQHLQAPGGTSSASVTGTRDGAFHDHDGGGRGDYSAADSFVPASKPSGTIAYILTLGVVDEMRRRGLARRLVMECIDLSRNWHRTGLCRNRVRAFALHVVPYNVAACKLYNNLGFLQLCELDDFYTLYGDKYSSYVYALYLDKKIREGWRFRAKLFFRDLWRGVLRLFGGGRREALEGEGV